MGIGTISTIRHLQETCVGFLTKQPILLDNGQILSWVNPNHVGFVYPEGMGLYLTLMSQLAAKQDKRDLTQAVHRVAAALQREVSNLGGVGINGKLYPFDTCMAVTGLLTYRRYLQGPVNSELLQDMAGFIVGMAKRKLAIANQDGTPAEVAPSWSTAFGASMLKETIALDLLATETDDRQYRDLALQIADEVIATCLSDGAFQVIPEDVSVYTHPHCYALEGLLHLRTRGYFDTSALLSAGAERLKVWQNPDGSLYNWNNVPPSRERLKVGDATAQAVRLWLAVDRRLYESHIEKGLSFLEALQSPLGGLYYCDGSQDVNSITTIFAVQAMEWYRFGAHPDGLA